MSVAKVDKLTLFAMLPAQALLSNLDQGFLAEPSDKKTLYTIWQKANANYLKIGFPSRSYLSDEDIRPIENVSQEKVEKTLNRIKLYPPYDSHQTSICNVRIGSLVTPQISVNVYRAEKRSSLKEKMSPEDLFDLAFQPSGGSEPITRQMLGLTANNGSLLYSSYNEDIRLHQPPQFRPIPINEKDPESLSFESVCMPVGGGTPFATAWKIPLMPGVSRLFVINGIHRLFKLAEAGYQWCPLAVAELSPLEVADPLVDLPKSILLDPNSNPPLLTDFLNKNVVIPLKYHLVLKIIRLNWGIEQYLTVLK